MGKVLDRQDTYQGSVWEPWTQNLYVYVGNNPVNYVDPTGHAKADPERGEITGNLTQREKDMLLACEEAGPNPDGSPRVQCVAELPWLYSDSDLDRLFSSMMEAGFDEVNEYDGAVQGALMAGALGVATASTTIWKGKHVQKLVDLLRSIREIPC